MSLWLSSLFDYCTSQVRLLTTQFKCKLEYWPQLYCQIKASNCSDYQYKTTKMFSIEANIAQWCTLESFFCIFVIRFVNKQTRIKSWLACKFATDKPKLYADTSRNILVFTFMLLVLNVFNLIMHSKTLQSSFMLQNCTKCLRLYKSDVLWIRCRLSKNNRSLELDCSTKFYFSFFRMQQMYDQYQIRKTLHQNN